jgi:hypothetical protein
VNRGPDTRAYVAANLDKVARMKSAPSPRIVFVGGSGLAYGIDSGRIGRAFSRTPVNLGLNAGFGLRYILDEAGPLLRPGDLVVVVPEYEQFSGKNLEGGQALVELLGVRRDPAMLPRLGLDLLLDSNRSVTSWSRTERNPGHADRSWFDGNGDVVGHLERGGKPVIPSRFEYSRNGRAFALLGDFVRECGRRGIPAAVLYPAVCRSFRDLNARSIASIQAELARTLGGNLASVDPEASVFEDRHAYDTPYHLNAKGRELRTDGVIRELGGWMERRGGAGSTGR